MQRRNYLRLMIGSVGVFAIQPYVCRSATARAETSERPIELHVDLAVDPSKEEEMLQIFGTSFKPACSSQPGYIDIKLLKLTSMLHGPAPVKSNYQLSLTFVSEDLRQQWIATPMHKTIWPKMEACLSSKDYSHLFYTVY